MLESLDVLLLGTRLFTTEKEMSLARRVIDLVIDLQLQSLLRLIRLEYKLPLINLKMVSLLEVIWTLLRQ